MKKRILSFLTAAFMLLGAAPVSVVPAAAESAAVQENEKSSIDRAAFEGLGFTNLDAQDSGESFFGTGNTVLMPKKELYFNYNGSSNYGQILRSGVSLYNRSTGKKERGAYKRYGQYRNGDWAKLNEDNGYGMGMLGGSELNRAVSSENKHQTRAYAKSAAYNSGSGRDSNVATLYIKNSDSKRSSQKISLELTRFMNEGQSKSTTTYTVENVGLTSALNESGYFYPMDYNALLDIAAGDFDGDGADEIAVYAANNKVIIYKLRGLGLYKLQEITDIYTDTGIEKSGDDTDQKVKRAAAVTLTAADLDKNNADELVITVSDPRGASLMKYRDLSYGYIYSSTGSKLTQQAKIPLYNGEFHMRAADSAAGDFTGSGRPILIFGGRAADNTTAEIIRAENKMALLTVTYNHSSKKYETGSIQKLTENFNSMMTAQRGDKYTSPIGLAAFNMYGETDGSCGERLFVFDRLYRYDGASFIADGTTIDYISDQRNNANEKTDKDQIWISEIVTGNFTKQDIGRREQLIAVVGQKEKGSDHYWFQIAYICADNNGNVYRNCEGVINQGTTYYNRTDKSREGTYLTLSAPDVDNDSMLLRFRGSETYYSKPEVQAILQSAPYFEDVADVYDDYLNNGATAYGKSESDTAGVSASLEMSLGVYTSEEVSLGGAAEFEASVSAVASFEHQSAWTNSTEVEYAGGVGDDYVVMYTVPIHRYVYDGVNVGSNKKSAPVIIEEPMTPVTVIVPVDKYDEIAAQYSGLETIRGNVLKSTPGNPSSYTSWGKGEFKKIGEPHGLANSGKGNGAIITVSKTEEESHDYNFAVGVEESLKAGGGAGFLGNNVKAGVVQSMTATVGGVFSNMDGIAYTGTVDNLPEGVTDFGFTWQLGYSTIKFNGEDIVVIGYRTSNVKRPPTTPKNAAITDIGRNEMTIEWDESPEAASYELSFITSEGEELLLANVPGTAADGGVVSYDVKGLDPGMSYTFAVRASDAYGARSLPSPQVSGKTLSDGNGEFAITEQPRDTQAAAGTEAAFTVKARATSSEPIRYQWYVYSSEDRQWEKIGSNTSELRLTVDETMDGSRYYCTVYQGTRVLKTKSVTLTIGLSESSTSLTVTNGGGTALSSGARVKANNEKTEITYDNQEVWTVSEYSTASAKYKQLGLNETETTDAESGQTSYAYSKPYIWLTENESGSRAYYETAVSGTNYSPDTSKPLSVESRYVFAASDGSTVETKAVPETVAAVTINGNSCTTAYAEIPSGGYIYALTYQKTVTGEDGSTSLETVTEYFRKKSGGGFDEYTFDSQRDLLTIGGTQYRADEFSEMKVLKTETVSTPKSVIEEGEKITLSASVADRMNGGISDGKVYFRIFSRSEGSTDSAEGSYNAADGKWTADYRFPDSGVYDITAVYAGSGIFSSSASEKLTINAYDPNRNVLSISGGSMTYGESLALRPTVINKSGAHENVNGCTYSVKKLGKDSSGKEVWTDITSTASGDRFTPLSTGKYRITAEYDDSDSGVAGGGLMTAVAEVSVSPKTVSVTANAPQGNLNEDESERRARVDLSIDGMTAADEERLRSCITVESDAFTAKTKGEYPIEIKLDPPADFAEKYSVVATSGVYSLTENTVTVKANVPANGTVIITYVTDRFDQDGNPSGKSTPLTVESGSQVPHGADVTFSAQPYAGFGVESWTVPEGMSNPGHGNVFTVEDISENVEVGVSFAISLSRISFEAADESGVPVTGAVGRVVGTYEDGRSFNSGDELPMSRTVTLTAIPGDGYVLCGWQKLCDASWEYIKADGTDKNDTSYVRTVSNVTESESYRALFAAREERTVSFSAVDGDGNPVSSAEFYVNGTRVGENAEGRIVYTAYKHQTLEIEVRTPDTVLVNYWTGGEGTVGGTNKHTVFDLRDNIDYTVHCTIPNTRTISYGAEWADGSTQTWTDCISASRGGTAVSGNPTTQPQGVVLEFTARAADGWRVKKWLLDGAEATGADVNTFRLTVDKNADVRVVFEKKPVVTMSFAGAEGNVSADSDGTYVANGAYVEFGSRVTFMIVPERGYIVSEAKLGGVPVALTVGTGNTDTRFYTAENVNTDLNFEVVFAKKPVISSDCGAGGSLTIRGTADFTDGAVISDGGYVDFGSDITLDIIPEFGYVAESVTAGGTAISFASPEDSDSIHLSLADINTDTAIVVTFRELEKHTVSFEVINTEAGAAGAAHGTLNVIASRKGMSAYEQNEIGVTVGTVDVYEGGAVTITAAADTGYRVKEWTVGSMVENGLGSTLAYTAEELGALAEKSFKVQFEEGMGRLFFAQPHGGALSAEAAGAEFTSGGTPTIGAEVEFTLAPEPHFVLKNWLLNGSVLTGYDSLTYVFTADGNDTVVAAELQKEKLDITASAETGGTVSGLPETVRHGSTVSLTAIPSYGYEFEGWYKNGTKIEGANEDYSFTAEENAAYVAKFVVKDGKLVEYSANDGTLGTISAAANGRAFDSGDTIGAARRVIFTASPAEGCRVREWTGLPAEAVISADKLTAEIASLDSDLNVCVYFEEIPTRRITIVPSENGSVRAEVLGAEVSEVREGTEVTFTAAADTGYMLSRWTEDAAGRMGSSFTVSVMSDMTVGAEFIAAAKYDVKYDIAEGTDGGDVSGTADGVAMTRGVTDRRDFGSVLTFTAAPDSGKMVKEWKVNGETVGELSNTLSFELKANTEVSVEFCDLKLWRIAGDTAEYTVEGLVRTPADYGTDSERTVRDGGSAEFNVVPASGMTLKNLEIADDTADTVELTANTDGSYSVKLSGIRKDVAINASAETGIPFTAQAAEHGSFTVKKADGTILESRDGVEIGDVLTITAAADSGYRRSAITVNGNVISGTSYTVADTDTEVTVAVSFAAAGGGGSSGGGGGSSVGKSFAVDFETNGGSRIDSVKVNEGETLTEPSAPEKVGFEFAGWYSDRELTEKYDFSAKVTASFTLYAKWVKKGTAQDEKWENPFGDVGDDDWFRDDVEYAVKNGLFRGISGNMFDPNGIVSRAMLVTVLWRAENEPYVNYAMTFADIDPDGYYAEAVRWAASEKIVKGYSEAEFAPDAAVTREQIAAIIHRYSEYKGENVSVGEDTNILSYSDFDSISEYAVPPMQYAVGAGLMKGKTENTINPKDNSTRAELAAVLRRFFSAEK